jgi:hypothetical protein
MTNLSPAAQALLDAYWKSPWDPSLQHEDRYAIAAALRAAADQVISPVTPPCEDFNEYDQGFLAAHIQYRDEFLAIADELEGL